MKAGAAPRSSYVNMGFASILFVQNTVQPCLMHSKRRHGF